MSYRNRDGHCGGNFGAVWGAVLILIGGALLLSNFGYLHVRMEQLWPLWLIGWGVAMLAGRAAWRRQGDDHE